jgi:hypothetical protein
LPHDLEPGNFRYVFEVHARYKRAWQFALADSHAVRQVVGPAQVGIIEHNHEPRSAPELRFELHQQRLNIEFMVERAVDENRGALVALVGQVGKRLVLADRFFARRVDRGKQPPCVVFARQPLDHTVVVSRQSGNFRCEKRVHIFAPTGKFGGSGHLRLLRNSFRCRFGLHLRQLSHPKRCTMFHVWPTFHRASWHRASNIQ